MKRILIIFVFMIMCISSAYSAIIVIESKRIERGHTGAIQTVTTVCIDGYKYVIVSNNGFDPIIVQSYERFETGGDYRPARCQPDKGELK